MRRVFWLSSGLSAALIGAAGCGDDKLANTSEASASASGTTTSSMTTEATTTLGMTVTTVSPTSTTDATTTNATTTVSPTTTTTDATTGVPTSGTTDATTGGGEFNFCQETCLQDADCMIDGLDQGYACERGVCADEWSTCESTDECVALVSGWLTSCASQMDCPGQVCIEVAGMGRCATMPIDFIECEALLMEEVQAVTIEGLPVTVCGETGTVCEDGVCRDPCESDGECFVGQPHCNVRTGSCECEDDDECAMLGAPSLSQCNAGSCGCGSDADCVGINIDTCYDGVCGCSSAAVCTETVFDGTQVGCAGPV